MAERYFLYPTVDRHSLVVWDMERQRPLGQLEGHDDEVAVVAARGSLAVSCQRLGPIRASLWTLETMQCTAALLRGWPDNGAVSACCMDGKVLLGLGDGSFEVWDACATVLLASFKGHNAAVCEFSAAAAGSMALSGSGDSTVRLWDLRTNGRCVRTMEGHSKWLCSVGMDGHCRTAVSSSADKTVKLWDLGSGRCTETYQFDGIVQDVVMHESGSSFLTSGRDSTADDVVCAWATDNTRAIMRADMASSCLPDPDVSNRLFASGDFSTIAFCCLSPFRMALHVWR